MTIISVTVDGGAQGATIGRIPQNSEADIVANQINADTANGMNLVVDMDKSGDNPDNADGLTPVGLVTTSGEFTIGSAYKYVVVGNSPPPSLLLPSSGNVGLTDDGSLERSLTILSTASGVFTYNAGSESGKIVDSSKRFRFDGSQGMGDWDLYAYSQQNYINATNGNNTIHAYGMINTITLGVGMNTVYTGGFSYVSGEDNQTVNLNSYTHDDDDGYPWPYNTVTLGKNSLVSDFNTADTKVRGSITVGTGSTISGGYRSTIRLQDTISGGDTSATANATADGIVQGGSDLLVVGGDITAIHLNNSTISANTNLTFLNGTGQTLVNGPGSIAAFGNQGLYLTLTSTSFDFENSPAAHSGLFVADQGNETLDASASTTPMQIYANTISGGSSTLVVMDGGGDDTLFAGTGNSSFSGYKGNNLFVFAKESNTNGSTVINSFATSNENKVALYNYGFTKDSLADWLKTAQQPINTDNTALTLDNNHKVIFSHVAPSQLTVDDFIIYNSPTTKLV